MIFIILLFALIGIYMLTGRGGFLVAGYNFMPETEKVKYNEKRLCQFVGIYMILTSIFVIFLEYNILQEYITIIIFLLITIAFIIFLNTSRIFKHRN